MAALTTPAAGAPSRRRWTWGVVLVAVIVAAAFSGLHLWPPGGGAAPEYVTVVAARGSVVPTVTTSGTVNPVTTVQVGTYVSGVIETISCDFNTRVRAGQLCATIDPRPYQVVVEQENANLAMAHAQLEKDRAALALAKLTFERNSDLLRRGIVSQEAMDTARSTFDQARTQIALDQATIAQHEAMLKAARINLGFTRIVSPVDGTVVSRNVTQGQTVAASFQTPTLFLIATDLTQMQVDTNVSESDIGRVAQGNRAVFTVEAYPGRSFAGQVRQVRQAPQMVQNVVTYDVVISASNPELLLKPGMTATMRIETGRADNVLRVPDQALRYKPAAEAAGRARAAAQVWVLDTAGRARQVKLQVGLNDDSYAEVTGGDLREGDRVIVSERGARAGKADSGNGGPRLPRL